MNYIGHGNIEIRERILSPLEVQGAMKRLERVEISGRCARECINLSYGFFSPLQGFMKLEETSSVCKSMCLPDGTLWPIPILLDISAEEILKHDIKTGDRILLTYHKKALSLIEVGEIFDFDRDILAEAILNTSEENHPGVKMIRRMKDRFISGKVSLVQEPRFNPPFDRFWYTPRLMREKISDNGWERTVAHQTRNVPHSGHEWLMKGAWFAANGTLPVETIRTGILVSCIIGPKRKGDFIDEAIVLGHQALNDSGYFRTGLHMVSIALWDMRYAGPKEAVFHAILRSNLGCSHHMFGRDHAGVGNTYDPYDAHRIFDQISPGKLNIKPVRVLEWWYCPVCREMTSSNVCGHEKEKQKLSGTMIRGMLQDKIMPSPQIFRKEVFEEIMRSGDLYGSGSIFCTENYLKNRQPVFELKEL